MYYKLFIIIVASSSVNSQLIESLNAVLDYGISKEIKDVNFIIGVAIAKGQLDILEKYMTEKHVQSTIQALQRKCATLINEVTNKVTPKQDPFTLILHSELWTFKSNPRPLHTPRSLSRILSPLSTEGPLSSSMSDDCLVMLLSHCYLPQTCLSVETSDKGGGYQVTHQVLYLTLLIQKCSTKVNSSKIQEMIKEKCAIALYQHDTIERLGFPPSMRDIYFEQIAVCAMHGFSEFLTPNKETLLLSLQTDQGCFSLFKNRESSRQKCDTHLSGVATAVLSMMVKQHIISDGN